MTVPKELASEFAKQLRSDLTEVELYTAVNLNNEETDPSICHSHDFCDANQSMLNAMYSLGMEFESDSAEQAKLLGAAWELARAFDFVI